MFVTMTRAMPRYWAAVSTWCSRASPIIAPIAGSTLIMMLKSRTGMRRRASISSAYGRTGRSSARPAVIATVRTLMPGAAWVAPSGAATIAATAMDIDRPSKPDQRAPTFRVSRMYAAQQPAAARAKPSPAGQSPGDPVNAPLLIRATPAAARSDQSRSARRREAARATASGPRNSMVAATPIGIRATAAKKRTVSAAEVAPRAAAAAKSRTERPRRRGRTTISRKTAAQASRIQAVPAAPSSGKIGVARAVPSCTDSIEPSTRTVPGTAVPGTAVPVAGWAGVVMISTQPRPDGRVQRGYVDGPSANRG